MALKRIFHASAANATVAVDSWWEASANPMRHTSKPIQGSHDYDVAIIGGGFTGLNAAKHLAKAGLNVCVCEAGHIGWGASGRNGGFCTNFSSGKSLPEIAKKYGIDTTRDAVRVQEEAIDQVRAFQSSAGLESHTPEDNAELAVAHSPYQLDQLKIESDDYERILGVKMPVFGKEALNDLGANSPDFHGGMILPWGFGLHPLNYLRALADATIDTGATVSPYTEITSITRSNGKYKISSEHADITANKIIIATNGYTSETIPAWSKGRILPVISSILVTRPITDTEQRDQGWTTHHMTYDSRILLHYFRLLPDGRMMFGGRGANSGNPDKQQAAYQRLRSEFEMIFPKWAHVDTDYQWSGCVGLNRKGSQFLGPIDNEQSAWASLAYHGSGVAMASWSGKAVAKLILGEMSLSEIPKIYSDPSHKFPFDFLRPQYLKIASAYYRYLDRQ